MRTQVDFILKTPLPCEEKDFNQFQERERRYIFDNWNWDVKNTRFNKNTMLN